MNDDTDRPRGILSPADREFLLGETEMEHDQSARNARARIRNRVTNGILDFVLLVHALEKTDRRQIFETAVDEGPFVDGLMAQLSFAYMGCKESGVEFAEVLEPAIRKSEEVYAAEVLGTTSNVDVSLDIDVEYGTELDDVTAAIRAGDAVTPAELFSVAIANDPVLDDVEAIDLHLTGDGPHDDAAFVERIATYLDAAVRDLPLNRARLVLSDAPGEVSGAARPTDNP